VQCPTIHLALECDKGGSDPVISSVIVALEINSHSKRLALLGVMLLDRVRIVSVWLNSLAEVPAILSIHILYEPEVGCRNPCYAR
jgi:hypothetical protein